MDTTSHLGTCKDIVPQEQAGHVERYLTNCSPDSPKGDALDKPSQLWPPDFVQCVKDGQPTNSFKSPEHNYTKHQELADTSCAYQPTSINVHPQHHTSLSTSLSLFDTTSSPLASNRNTPTVQGLKPIEEDEVTYNIAGNFIMNPLAPTFVPRQEGQISQGGQLNQGGQPSRGDQQGMLSLSLEHCRGTVSDPFDSKDGP